MCPKARMCLFVRSTLLRNIKIRICEVTETIIISDVSSQIVGHYRPFKLVNHISQKSYVQDTINFLKRELVQDQKTIIVGDFNLDYAKISDDSYSNRQIFDIWLQFIDELGLIQFIQEPTWSRCINGKMKNSILDHCYSNSELSFFTFDSMISDHKGIFIGPLKTRRAEHSLSLKRKWKTYTPTSLKYHLSLTDWERFRYMDLEQKSDFLDIEILSALHKVSPEVVISSKDRHVAWSDKLLKLKKKKRNLQKRGKRKKNKELIKRAKHLNKEFRKAIISEKREKIRKTVNLGNQSSIWDAINLAEDKYGENTIPGGLHLAGKNNNEKNKALAFSDFFENKISVLKTGIPNTNVEDGSKIVEHIYESPFTKEKVLIAMNSMKKKNSYGHDRVPMRALLDSAEFTIDVIVDLFNKIEVTQYGRWKNHSSPQKRRQN